MDGVLNVLKPAGMTSFDVIARLRRIYGQKKIGHGGTLDPMAAGVLPVFLGRATRLIEYAPIHRKTYEAEFLMGLATDTEDVTGTVVETGEIPADPSIWESTAESFKGDILQRPSSYSAIKVNGERAYKLAREGNAVELPPRPVTIYDLILREVKPPLLRLSVTCSAGTTSARSAATWGKRPDARSPCPFFCAARWGLSLSPKPRHWKRSKRIRKARS